MEQEPNIFRKHLSEPWFSFVKFWQKTVEGRLNKGDFAKMKKGDVIVFYNEEEEITKTLLNVRYYPSFEAYLLEEGIENCLPGIYDLRLGLNVYYTYFSPEDEEKYGVVALIM